MPLTPIQLDTLTWDQIVTAIQTRIIPESLNKWTLQAPVDPGVTMLELFAWLLDQRIYWMGQTPDALGLAILSLLGVSPMPAQAAVTVLQLQDSAVPPRSFPLAAAGALMQLGDSNPPLLFTLDDPLILLPVDSIGLSVDSVDRSNDLHQGRPISLLSAGKNATQIGIDLTLPPSSSIPATAAGEFFSLMILLATPTADVPAEWSAEAVSGIPAPATVSWSYTSSANGAIVAFPPAQVHDGTAGLRRSGVVRLPLPNNWQPEPQGAGVSTTSYKVLLQIDNAGFTFAPLLLSLTPNVVLAHHVWQRTKMPATSDWLPLPGNVISLPAAPSDSSLTEYPPIENTVQLQITERDGDIHPWQLVADLSLSGPTDRVFLLDRAHSEISFGDGLTGRLPVTQPNNASAAVVSYQAGGGTDGNVGEGLFWEGQPGKDSDPFPLFTAVNLAPGDGGAESETLDLAEERARAALNERNRAVSQADYENLVQTTPGVGFRRAYAAVGYHPDFPCLTVPGAVTVFVVPYAPRVQIDGDWASDAFVAAPQPDPGALQAARAYLNDGRLIGADVFVCGPIYRSVWLALVIAVDAAPSAALRETIITGLQNYLDPLVGGDQNEGWSFGNPVRPTGLLRVVQDIVGTAGDVQSVSVRLDGMTTAESCQDVPIRPHELVTLAHVDLHTPRRPPPSGGLR